VTNEAKVQSLNNFKEVLNKKLSVVFRKSSFKITHFSLFTISKYVTKKHKTTFNFEILEAPIFQNCLTK
jgi:hypothetical protein